MDAVLWDMDGVLVDSEPLWTVAEVELAASLGGTWTDELKAAVVGTRLDVAVPTILRALGAADGPEDVARASAQLLARMVQLYGSSPPLIPGAVALATALRAEAVPQALVSSSYRVLVDAVLAQGVGPFALSVAGDEVRRAKPDPEPYLTAAARLGVDARRCLVVEDSPAGVAAAEAAGCAVLAVPSVVGVDFVASARRGVVPSLDDVTVHALRRLTASPPQR